MKLSVLVGLLFLLPFAFANAETSPPLLLTRTLSLGTSGNDVSALQQHLRGTGDFTYPEITGYFGAMTEAAVQAYQCRANIVCSGSASATGYGIVGPRTKTALSQPSASGMTETATDSVKQSVETTANTLSVPVVIAAVQGATRTPEEPTEPKLPKVDTSQCIAAEIGKILPFLPPNDDPAVSIPASARTTSTLYADSRTGFYADDTNYFTKWSCTSSTGITTIRKLNIIPTVKEGETYTPYHDPNLWKDSPFLSYDEFSGGFPIVYFTQGLNGTEWLKSGVPLGSPSLFNLRGAYWNAQDNKWYIKEVSNDYNDSHGISSQDGRKGDYVLNDYNKTGCNQYYSSCANPGWGPTANKPGSQSLIPGVLETPVDVDAVNKSYALYGYGSEGLTTIREGGGDVICRMMNPTLFDFTLAGRRPVHMIVSTFSSKKGVVPGTGCPSGSKLAVNGVLPDGVYVFKYADQAQGWQLERKLDLPAGETGAGALNYVYGTANPWKFLQGGWRTPALMVSLKTDGTMAKQDILSCASDGVFGEPSGYPDSFIFIGGEAPYVGPTFGLTKGTLVHDVYFATKSNAQLPLNGNEAIMRSDLNKVYRDVVGRNQTLPEAFVWRGTTATSLRATLAAGPVAKGAVEGYHKTIYGSAATTAQTSLYLKVLADGGSLYDVVNMMAKGKCSTTGSITKQLAAAWGAAIDIVSDILVPFLTPRP